MRPWIWYLDILAVFGKVLCQNRLTMCKMSPETPHWEDTRQTDQSLWASTVRQTKCTLMSWFSTGGFFCNNIPSYSESITTHAHGSVHCCLITTQGLKSCYLFPDKSSTSGSRDNVQYYNTLSGFIHQQQKAHTSSQQWGEWKIIWTLSTFLT